jgi:hypothetical protein
MNIETAIKFVKNNGNEVELARLDYIMANEIPSENVKASLFANQRSDGGWSPFWADNYSSLDATCFRLAQAEQLGINQSEDAVIRAVKFLADCQSADGSWEEDVQVVALAPPWAKPGDLSAKLYLTSNCGFWLVLLGYPGNKASKAAEYLQTYLDQDGHLPGFLHTNWLAGGLWYKLDRQAFKQTFIYLDKRVNDLATSNISWLITTLCAAGVSLKHFLLENAVTLLEKKQKDDGCWESEDGSSQNVHSTLEALRALSLCGRDGKQ